MIDWAEETYRALQEDAETPPQSQEIASLRAENASLRESIDEVRMMFDAEDRGWSLIGGLATGDRLEGLDLDEVKEVSEKIRPRTAVTGLVKRGSDLHSGYVWSKGVNIDGVKTTGKPGAPTNLMKFFREVTNQEHIFSATAHEEMQKARFADGNVFVMCDNSDRTVRVLPLKDITSLRVDPDFPSEVIAYRREWNTDPEGNPKVMWYYTNRYKGRKQKTFTIKGVREPVSQTTTIIDRHYNRAPGWVLGVPDALAAMPWIAAYDEIMVYGRVVNESLAKILFRVTNKTKQGVQNTGVKMRGFAGHGGTASMAEGQELTAVSTAGKGYDFSSARPVAAQAAAALNVPNMELLADSSAAGSSYGAAASLTPTTKNAMRLMQAEWVELYQEILDFFGLGYPRIWFEPLDDIEPYRAAQALTLLSGNLSDVELRSKSLDILDIAGDPSVIPATMALRGQTVDAASQAAAPGQGQSNGTGGGGQGANDLRSDTISNENLRHEMAMTDIANNMLAIVERFEAAK